MSDRDLEETAGTTAGVATWPGASRRVPETPGTGTRARGSTLRTGVAAVTTAVAGVWPGKVESEECWLAINQTPWPIWAECDEGRIFTLGPLERRRLNRAPPRDFLQRLIDRRQLVVRTCEAAPRAPAELTAAVRLIVVVVVVWLGWILVGWSRSWMLVGAAMGLAALIVLFLLATQPNRLGDVRRARQWTWQGLTMLTVLVVAIVAPALSLGVRVADFGVLGEAATDPGARLDITGRHMQLTLIAVAAMLPALLFFQFDAERLSTQRDRWLHTIFRIDPSLATISDVEAKYGKQLEEAYGTEGDGRGRLTRGRRSPLIVATVTLTFGWLLILLGSSASLGAGSGDELRFRDLLTPEPSVITFAFLGAYFFGLNLVYDGYVRGDLRPKTYHQITTRVLFVVIIAWLIDVSFATGRGDYGPVPEQVLYGMAFVAGITPRPVLHWVTERLPLHVSGREELTQADQLRSLDGIDLYERTRLADEGIRTIQALAHSDLTDLFFKTRIASARLIDWLDQAVLQLYLAYPDEPVHHRPDDQPSAWRSTVGRLLPSRSSSGGVGAVETLRSLGIRTATDLLDALKCEETKKVVTQHLKRESCRWADETVDGRLDLLQRALQNSEWTGRVHYWRRSSQTAVEPRKRRWIDRDGNLRRGDPRFAPVAPRLPAARALRAEAARPQTRLVG
jgi:hypothetical protein